MTRHSNPWLGPLLVILAAQIAVAFLARLGPTLAPALSARLDWSVTDVGLLSAVVAVGSAVFTLAGLPLVLRTGPIRILQAGLLVGAVGTLLHALPSSACLILGSFLVGLAAGPQTAAGSDVLHRHAPAGRKNLVFSIKQAGVPLGGVLAGLLMPVLAESVGLVATFGVCAALAVATLLAMQPLQRRLDEARDREQSVHLRLLLSVANLKRPLRTLALDANLRRIASVGGCLALGQAAWFTFLVSHLVLYRNLSLAGAGALFAVMQVVSTFGRPALGWLADRLSPLAVLKAAVIASTLATVALACMTPLWPDWAVIVLMLAGGVTVSSWNGVQIAQVAHFSRPGTVGESTVGATMLVFLGNMCTPALFGLVVALGGDFRIAFGVAAACTLAALLPLAKLPSTRAH